MIADLDNTVDPYTAENYDFKAVTDYYEICNDPLYALKFSMLTKMEKVFEFLAARVRPWAGEHADAIYLLEYLSTIYGWVWCARSTS